MGAVEVFLNTIFRSDTWFAAHLFSKFSTFACPGLCSCWLVRLGLCCLWALRNFFDSRTVSLHPREFQGCVGDQDQFVRPLPLFSEQLVPPGFQPDKVPRLERVQRKIDRNRLMLFYIPMESG